MSTTPAIMGMALARDAMPTVGTAAERNTRFPNPPVGFKVFCEEANSIQRFNGGWADVGGGTGDPLTDGSKQDVTVASNGSAFVVTNKSDVSPWDYAGGVDLTNVAADPGAVASAIENGLNAAADEGRTAMFHTKEHPVSSGSLFRVNRQIVVAGDVMQVQGMGGSLHAIGTRLQWVTGSASSGLVMQSAAGASGNGSAPSGFLRNVTLLKESALAQDGTIGLVLNGLRQFQVDSVLADGFEIGFDLTNNSFGAEFRNCRVWQNPSAFVGVNIRTGTQSGNDLNFYNCWFAGKNAAVHVSGGTNGIHFKGGQLTAGQGYTSDQDGLGVIVFGKDYLTGATASCGILDFDGVDFENCKRMWHIRGYERVQLQMRNCAFLANESGSQPALGLYKFEGLNDSKVDFDNCTIRGVYSQAAMYSEAGANSGYGISEKNWLSTTPTTVNGGSLGAGWFLSSRAYTGSGRGVAIEHTGSLAQLRLNGVLIRAGTGSPEGALTAPIGSLFLRSNGGANTAMYVKESGTGNTGWVAK